MRNKDHLQIGVVGISHRQASLKTREEIARGTLRLEENGAFLKAPLLFLSTCNRTEIYFSGEDLIGVSSELLSFFRGKGSEDVSLFYSLFGIDCFSHLCKVTTGLDSAIIGETEIQHQVKLAYMRASSAFQFPKALPKALHYAFQKALRIGKQARARFAPLSPTLNEILWKIAEKHQGPLSKVLLVGNSEINRRFAKFLSKQRNFSLTLATSNPKFSEKVEGVTVTSRAILQNWQDFDWLIFATRAGQYLIGGKGAGHHLVFDLSVPRNVDPNTQRVSLWNIEKITQEIEKERRLRPAPEACVQFVEESARRYASLYRSREERWVQLQTTF
ncbi:MAG TPA: hypothetical protein VJK48_01735 [Chlamydiales bacterium]|nr:hypothetical protein [Chlamydiales bacterium]